MLIPTPTLSLETGGEKKGEAGNEAGPSLKKARATRACRDPGDTGTVETIRARFLENGLQSCRCPGTPEFQSWEGPRLP